MKRAKIYLCKLVLLIFLFSCNKEELFQNKAEHSFWLSHKGAKLPVTVEGNTKSKVFVILLHGGPGASAQEFNAFNQPFTDVLEEDYAMVYYDQRNAGLSRGAFDAELYTIAQHIEDLEKIIELLEFKYGNDIQIFLSGHSWGGALGSAFLMKNNNQDKVKAWINIDGGINRNRNYLDRLVRIPEIANEQINSNSFVEEWTQILQEIEEEQALGISQYSLETERNLNRIMVNGENLLARSEIFSNNVNSTFSGIYFTNFHPFIDMANDFIDTKPLQKELYEAYDQEFDNKLNKLTLPTLSIYGKYDIRTPLQQGEYLLENISTPVENKEMIIIENAGHSPMRNETGILAKEISNWIEKYR